ncbi:hypothetical protein [Kineococcus aurantiacus]|uniref:Uncharacterized protein n=1 Tax=Kineococcus aurantiacus TaxID=37633 RepID=A0A7Y9DKY1_9ACTN|nr:hypothetical protein [Kineococcus aurantiacus]NYD22410.1 hypothetical protein [Kineococcus aurantiacus]
MRRVEMVVGGTPPGPAREALEAFLPRVDLVARAVRAQCLQAQAVAPSSSAMLVPGGPDGEHPEVHRRLTRTATACAQVAEAAAMVRVSGTADAGRLAAVERAVVRAEELALLR